VQNVMLFVTYGSGPNPNLCANLFGVHSAHA